MSYHIEINEYQRRLIMKALTSTDVNQFSQAQGSGDAFDTEAKELANGAARKAHERDKRATETRLRGWGGRTRTQKCRRKISLWKVARIPRIRAEFRPGRPLAFELQRRGYAARGWVLPGSSASVLHGRWPSCGVAEKARTHHDAAPARDLPPVTLGHIRGH